MTMGRRPELSNADVVLIGVSRCGKTPTPVSRFAVRHSRGQLPLIPEDFGNMTLPGQLKPFATSCSV
jgi:regulator of PEP synthase PpsR (kinase-PPPase family)